MSSLVVVSGIPDDVAKDFLISSCRSWRDESFECEHIFAGRQENP
jgi:hypothetical protein